MFLKYLYLIIICIIMLGFIINWVYSLIKDIKIKNAIKRNPQHIKGVIREIKKVKNRMYILVEFESIHNRLTFTETFELFDSDVKGIDYQEGMEIDMIYNDVSNMKKVRSFPLLLADLKVRLEKGPLFLNTAVVVMGGILLAQTIFTFINKKAFTSDIQLIGTDGIYNNYLILLVMMVVYFIVIQYLVTALIEIPRRDLQNYLKIYGNVTKARVKTYKFGRNKDAKGNKESLIELEFRTNEGVQVDTKLSSFLYTETQEEYIDIIYDPKSPKNIVYLKNN